MILLPKQPKLVEKKGNWAHFQIEELYPGYGVTIGNSLRRVLLSSLPGSAVTNVKIKGVQHEFSTMDGVIEDVIVIMMNLKKMRFKMYTDEPQKATLKVKGEKEVKGSDFDFSSQVELVNKDCHIATITDKKKDLEMEITIEKGIGYEPVEMRKKKEKLEIGVIPVDAIFTPIKRVSFKVENMRVGERTDFDKLDLEIETDGILDPEKVFLDATQILVDHFSGIRDSLIKPEKKSEPVKKEKKEEDVSKKSVEDLKLSQRTLTALLNGNIKTVGGLSRKSEESLSSIEGLGDTALVEIKKALKKLGIELK